MHNLIVCHYGGKLCIHFAPRYYIIARKVLVQGKNEPKGFCLLCSRSQSFELMSESAIYKAYTLLTSHVGYIVYVDKQIETFFGI